ncbi:MAG: tRNA-(ms[2]io[6]A)-hydroxylase [Pseudomonadales bacterium]|nr:tRNA-(ms[2]io[6]A)-hydroxylase [Pseudomonadales bacterium]
MALEKRSSQIDRINRWLHCPTPQRWIDAATGQLDLLLIDHANCEKKAASSALNLLFRYVEHPQLMSKMAQLAREELLHFEQVLALMTQRGIHYQHLPAGDYAALLHQGVRRQEPGRLVDLLIVGAVIEARSCERFARLAPHLDAELGHFYRSLLRSEARHYQDYLDLARQHAGEPIEARVEEFLQQERRLIERESAQLRFHSGVPLSPDQAVIGKSISQ